MCIHRASRVSGASSDPNVARGAAKSWRAPSDIALIVPVMTIVGDSDEGMLLRGTDDKGVDVLVVTDRFIHE
jgi:hypothetical protein